MKLRRNSRITKFTLTALLLLTGCSRRPRNSKTLFVMVPKLVGIPYFNSARDGAAQEVSRLGLHFFYTGPTAADAGLQVDVIAGLLARHPAVLAVSCDDANALAPVLRRARRFGIPVLTWDADAQPDARDWFVSQLEDETLGRHVMDVLRRAARRPRTIRHHYWFADRVQSERLALLDEKTTAGQISEDGIGCSSPGQ